MGSNQSFTSSLEWRRAVKHFSQGEVDVKPIVEAMVNAPSSFGLQPYKILAITNKELKERLKPVSYNQDQVTECQTLFILCARTDVEVRAEEYLKANESASALRDYMMGFAKHLPDKTAWAARQAYIALGFGLAAAAEHRIASCPMEGFQAAEVSTILELPSNLVPVVYLAVGEATQEDGTHARFRFPESDLLVNYE
jgi:nitroreductase / dihydropteridine reductase